jgi:hypothetical protein
MNDGMIQYHINTEWRKHVINYYAIKKKKEKAKESYNESLYCNNNAVYSTALKIWIEFLVDEEKYVFYNSIVDMSINDSINSYALLMKYIDLDLSLRMPLLRDVVISYLKPFKKTQGRLNKNHTIEASDIAIEKEDLLVVHNKLLAYRDQVFAHYDLSIRSPRSSSIGISLRGQGYYWEDYAKIIPQIGELLAYVKGLIIAYKEKHKLDNHNEYFNKYVEIDNPTTELSPKYLNELHLNSLRDISV